MYVSIRKVYDYKTTDLLYTTGYFMIYQISFSSTRICI